jgi:type II secretory pathway component GspD/PulD (secretin)
LQFADAKAVATIIKEVFPGGDTSSRGSSPSTDPRAQFYEMIRSRFSGDHRNHGAPEGAASSSGGRATRVAATADENNNAVVVGAPGDLMPAIEDLIKEIDTDVEDITVVRVFRLKYADPTEMADLLSGLFPDDSNTGTANGRSSYRFGYLGRSSSSSSGGSAQSNRMQRKGRVLAVPDRRTAAVVVSADKSLMTQIAAMIEELDANPAKKQKVFVYSLENAEAQSVEQILRGLFDNGNSSRNNRSTAQKNNALDIRSQQMQNSVGTSTGFGNGGLNGQGRSMLP